MEFLRHEFQYDGVAILIGEILTLVAIFFAVWALERWRQKRSGRRRGPR